MRPSNKQRSRNKPGNNGNQHNQQRRSNMGNVINRVFESAGPDGKVRGTPQQIIDKYQMLARDAQLAGDRVAAESYLQYAEHYSRLLGEAQRQQQEARVNQEREEGQRSEEGQREENRPQRFDDGYEPERRQQPQPQPQPAASGLAMIETDDSFDLAGPIETPEGRRRAEEPTPVVPMSSMMPPMPSMDAPAPVNGGDPAAAEGAAAEAEPASQPVKRSRPRRRSKPAGDAALPEPAEQAE